MGSRWIGALWGSGALFSVACEEGPPPPPPGPCESASAEVDVAPPWGDYGDFVDGVELWCGNPPQGGAPYSPFRFRLLGPEAFADGVELVMTAADPDDGTELGWTSLTMGLTCANVGESAGYWVGSEAHLRYSGWSLDELGGKAASITMEATAISDASVFASRTVEAVLVTSDTTTP
jgi:hypothetical protein